MQRDGRDASNSGRGDSGPHPPRDSPACYRVGDLLVDVGQARVTRGDRLIPLPKLSFDLLVALIHGAPNLVSLDALMAEVWPGLVVSPETVSQRVKLLRDALDDDPKQPRYVAGVRGRGYRLITQVGTSTSPQFIPETPNDSPGAPAIGQQLRRRRALLIAAVLLVAVGVAAVIGSGMLRQSNEQRNAGQVSVARVPVRSIAILPFQNLSTEPDARALALGISESVMHQLASHNQLLVIARSSSFAFEGRNVDAREIGRVLNARYLLEGSLQSAHTRLRVTAQLVDTQTGARLWSMRFDRTPTDLFALQDEIAAAVASALELSVAVKARPPSTGPGTTSLEAWIAYQQGRNLAATRRLVDLEQAEKRFAEATRLDPAFASAYIARAETRLVRGLFQRSDSWLGLLPDLPPEEKTEVDQWLARAIALNDGDGTAFTVRAWSREDPYEAEADYRHGLALSPNDAVGYERFAKLLYSFREKNGVVYDPARREEAFETIDRARAIDPLSPTAPITRALMLFYGRGEVTESNALLLQALALQPNYYPVIVRLAEIRYVGQGQTAEAIKYAEQALALEPQAAWARRFLVRMYLDIGDLAAARAVAAESAPSDNLTRIPVYLAERNWQTAGELAYGSEATLTGLDSASMAWAWVRQAQATGDLERAIRKLEERTAIEWDTQGKPRVYETNLDYTDSIALAQLLRSTGREQRAGSLLQAVLRLMDHAVRDLKRPDLMCSAARSGALEMSGDREGALRVLERSSSAGRCYGVRQRLEIDPALDELRGDPRFQAVLTRVRAQADDQRSRLEALQTAGVVPVRGPPKGRQ